MKNPISYQKVPMVIATSIALSVFGSCSAQPNSAITANASQSSPVFASQGTSDAIAEKNGVVLTESHFQKIIEIEMATEGLTYLPIADQIALKSGVIEAFNIDPQGIIERVHQMYAEIPVEGTQQGAQTSGQPNTSQGLYQSGQGMPAMPTHNLPAGNSGGQRLAAGHNQLRQNLDALSQRSGTASQFTPQSFNQPSVNQLRAFTGNSQWVNQTSTEYYSGTTIYTFCADGTFHYQNSSSMSVGAEMPGGGGYESSSIFSSGQDGASGYWDAYGENGNDAILVFSADPRFASESMNNTGLMAYPIANYEHDVVQFGQRGQPATVDMLIRRRAITGCS